MSKLILSKCTHSTLKALVHRKKKINSSILIKQLMAQALTLVVHILVKAVHNSMLLSVLSVIKTNRLLFLHNLVVFYQLLMTQIPNFKEDSNIYNQVNALQNAPLADSTILKHASVKSVTLHVQTVMELLLIVFNAVLMTTFIYTIINVQLIAQMDTLKIPVQTYANNALHRALLAIEE